MNYIWSEDDDENDGSVNNIADADDDTDADVDPRIKREVSTAKPKARLVSKNDRLMNGNVYIIQSVS